MLLRRLRRRCPCCGGGDLFACYLQPRACCPRCGLKLDRGEEDFFLGAYALNLVTAELLLVAFLALIVVAMSPDVPWRFLLYGGAALMFVAPILFFPVSRTLWLAIELAGPGARAEHFGGE